MCERFIYEKPQTKCLLAEKIQSAAKINEILLEINEILLEINEILHEILNSLSTNFETRIFDK